VNYPLTDDLKNDEKPIVSVKDYKNFFENFLVNSVDQLSNIRKIKFNRNGIFATTELLSNSLNMNINLLKSNIIVDKFDFQNLKYAYNNFLPIKKTKFDDVKHLLKYVVIPENVKFYDSITYSNADFLVSKSKIRARDLIINRTDSYCECKGKCIRLCSCKKNNNFCTENCFCLQTECKNKNSKV
jgi:hypothetical protein